MFNVGGGDALDVPAGKGGKTVDIKTAVLLCGWSRSSGRIADCRRALVDAAAAWRRAHKIPQSKIAETCNTYTQRISKWENHEFSSPVIMLGYTLRGFDPTPIEFDFDTIYDEFEPDSALYTL